MLRNNADARRCSYFELGLPVKERLQGDHCFLHFSRSDSERENSDWSELRKKEKIMLPVCLLSVVSHALPTAGLLKTTRSINLSDFWLRTSSSWL